MGVVPATEVNVKIYTSMGFKEIGITLLPSPAGDCEIHVMTRGRWECMGHYNWRCAARKGNVIKQTRNESVCISFCFFIVLNRDCPKACALEAGYFDWSWPEESIFYKVRFRILQIWLKRDDAITASTHQLQKHIECLWSNQDVDALDENHSNASALTPPWNTPEGLECNFSIALGDYTE